MEDSNINKYKVVGVQIIKKAEKDFQKWHQIIIERTQFSLKCYVARNINIDDFIGNMELLSRIVEEHEKVACLEENAKRINALVKEKGKQIYEWLKEKENDLENEKYSTKGKNEEEFTRVLLENLVKEPWIEENYINENYEIESLSYSCDILESVNVFCRFEKVNQDYELGEFYIDYIG